MAKSVYAVRESLDKGFGDTEINVGGNSGIGRPMKIKVILGWILMMLLGLAVIAKSFMAHAGLGLIALFLIIWIALTALLLTRDKTGSPQFMLIPTMINYLPKKLRYVITRKSADANDFYKLVGIDEIDDDGLVCYSDGSFGRIYRVVGSASILLFDSDRDAILNRVERFYNKIGTDATVTFMTTKEAQKVYRQIANLERKYRNLEFDDPDVKEMADAEYKQLYFQVGGTFRSIHQYMILRAPNEEALRYIVNIVASECENSSLMFKQCVLLGKADIELMLRTIYQGKESI